MGHARRGFRGPEQSGTATWIEITKSEHRHGGDGWEFGTCLWSPAKNKSGHEAYRLMRRVRTRNEVFHFYSNVWDDRAADTRFCGTSTVAHRARLINTIPPSPGEWNVPPYFRIELTDYRPLRVPVRIRTPLQEYADEITQDLQSGAVHHYPFYIYRPNELRTVQGVYLTRATASLRRILMQAAEIEEADAVGDKSVPGHGEFAEGRRRVREAFFFIRHPKLAGEAKRRYGYTCVICGFNFGKQFGTLGEGYIECHHLNPLSERDEVTGTQTS